MTLQQFYEKMIRLSLSDAEMLDDDTSPLKLVCKQFNDIDSASIDEICVHATLVGIPIPRKANFKKFGEDYLIQCLYFLDRLCDTVTLDIMIKCIMKYKTLQSIITSNFKKQCIEVYISNILRQHEISCILSEYIYKYCTDIPEFEQFRILGKSTGIISAAVPYFEL